VPGVSEVLHAQFTGFAYPMHTHDEWTLLIVDDGCIRYDLDRKEWGALADAVTLLPPQIPHNGCAVTPAGFRKRVIYLDTSELGTQLVGSAVDRPVVSDPRLRYRIHQLHEVLKTPGDEFEAESRLLLITERLRRHLGQPLPVQFTKRAATIAGDLRDLLDERFVPGVSLREAADVLHAHPTHLVRAFTNEFGLSPHQYLIGRRISLARRLLLSGRQPQAVAALVGFYDQSHFSRHFRRIVGVSPGRYTRGGKSGHAVSPPAPPAAG
jgi:AraC-like DNA-binding protein